MASSLFLLSYLMASLIIFSAAFTALGRANPSLVVPCNVLKLPSSALTQATFTVNASGLSFATPYVWKPVVNGVEYISWGGDLTNWGYFDVSRLQKGLTYGVYYQVTTANQVPVTGAVTLKLQLPDGVFKDSASPIMSLLPWEYTKIKVESFKNTYSSGSIKFEMTSQYPQVWANNLIINSVVIIEE